MVASVKSVSEPAVVIRPIELLPLFVNHRRPSGPVVMPSGWEMPTPSLSKLPIAPPVVICPIESLPKLTNHRLPSGPTVMSRGWEMVASLKN